MDRSLDHYNGELDQFSWAVGIIEGEGWIGTNYSTDSFIPRIEVEMSDHDVINDLFLLFGGSITFSKRDKDGNKDMWRWSLHKQDKVVELLVGIHPYMSERRTLRIREVLNKYYFAQDKKEKNNAIHK